MGRGGDPKVGKMLLDSRGGRPLEAINVQAKLIELLSCTDST